MVHSSWSVYSINELETISMYSVLAFDMILIDAE